MRQVSGTRQNPANQKAKAKPRPRVRHPHLLTGNSTTMRMMRGFVWAGTSWPATVAALLFLASASAYAAALGGHFSKLGSAAARLSDGAANSVGLSAHNVSISGLKRATREDILEIVGVEEGGSIVGFDARAARRRLEAQDWIASASILRQFPNTLHVEIVEREPFALWQHKGEFFVIDGSGATLSKFAVRDHLDLPIVVGAGAETQALPLINQLEAWDDVRSQVRAAVRVAERRWNLYFNNGIKVLLPEEDVERALRELDRLHRQHQVLNLAVDVIDLRTQERTVLRLSDDAAGKRRARLAKVSKR
jgi:cell division protein FtsQ